MSSTNHHSVKTVPTLCVHHGISEQLLSVDVDRLLRDLLDHRTILAHPLLRETVLGKTWASKWGSVWVLGLILIFVMIMIMILVMILMLFIITLNQ